MITPARYNIKMPDRFLVPAEEAQAEIRVANSRFIGTIAPVFSVEEARNFIQRMREKYSDASHNVPAFVVGHGPSVTAHCNDDGEPPGTAGRPALAVLQGSGLGDAAVVVTRYFGGTKLGTGGLVRAYGDAVRVVLAVVPVAEKASTHKVVLAVPYHLFEQTKLLIGSNAGVILAETFAAEVTLTVQIRVESYEAFEEALQQLSHGAVEAEIVESNEGTIMPLV
jgi:uncharacterized YigZ family protein